MCKGYALERKSGTSPLLESTFVKGPVVGGRDEEKALKERQVNPGECLISQLVSGLSVWQTSALKKRMLMLHGRKPNDVRGAR